MMETWKMWRLVRCLKENQHKWIDWDNINDNTNIEGFVVDGTPSSRHIQRLVNIGIHPNYSRTLRLVLAKKFGDKMFWKKFPTANPPRNLGEEEQKIRYDFLEKSFADAQQEIDDCVHKGFIDEDEGNKQLVFLTLKGKKFATPYGLIKEWVMEDIGEMRFIIGAIIGTAALIKLRVIFDFIRGILLVVFSQRI